MRARPPRATTLRSLLPAAPRWDVRNVPTEDEIVSRLADIVAVLRRAVGGGRLTAGEAVDCLDMLAGLEAALNAHHAVAYWVHECARELALRARILAEAADHRPDGVVAFASTRAKPRKV